MSKPISTHPYYEIHDWSDHQADTTYAWIKNYTALLANPRYQRTTVTARAILHGLWLARALHHSNPQRDPHWVRSCLSLRRVKHVTGALKELEIQGFLVPTKTKKPRQRRESRKRRVDRRAERGSARQASPFSAPKPDKISEWEKAFPQTRIEAEIAKADQWLRDNPNRRPRSQRGYTSFLSRWFLRTQERAERLTGGVREPRKYEPTDAEIAAETVRFRKEQEAGNV